MKRKIKFGRFTYPANFAYASTKEPIFGYIDNSGQVFNCEEDPKTGKPICGKVQFTNIDQQKVRESLGEHTSTTPCLINWWDCRINRTIDSCILQ